MSADDFELGSLDNLDFDAAAQANAEALEQRDATAAELAQDAGDGCEGGACKI